MCGRLLRDPGQITSGISQTATRRARLVERSSGSQYAWEWPLVGVPEVVRVFLALTCLIP